jgi:carboxymethylenebutenolidase
MKKILLLSVFLIAASIARAQSPSTAGQQQSPSFAPTSMIIPSGDLRLGGLLWMPAGSGPFPAVLFNNGLGSAPASPAAAGAHSIGPVFAKHGYAFLYLFRRGDGLSVGQGTFLGDTLSREATANGREARQRLQLLLLTTEQLDDVTAGLRFLKGLSGVDRARIAVAGHSFGGQLALLAAERDTTIRAVVTFAAAAAAWEGSPELRERLLIAVRNIMAPIFLTHAANDFSIVPAQVLAARLAQLKRPHELKIYGAVGDTPAAGHGAVYSDIMTWETDVFGFLDEHVRPR